MTEYEVNQAKPERLLLGYVTLRGPDLEQVYWYVKSNSPCSESDIVDELFVGAGSDGSSHHEECLRFLSTVDMVQKTDEAYKVMNEEICGDTSFGLKLLYHLKQQEAKQSSLTYILDLISKENISETSQSDLIKTIERDESDYGFSWTDPKIKQWSYLMDYIGVIQMESERELTFYPQRGFVLELLQDHQNTVGEDDLASLFEYINENYWFCLTQTTPPTVSVSLSSTLLNMNRTGAINLRSLSDGNEIRLAKPEGEGYENYTNYSITVEDDSSLQEVV